MYGKGEYLALSVLSFLSFLRRQESKGKWIPIFMGMTENTVDRILTFGELY